MVFLWKSTTTASRALPGKSFPAAFWALSRLFPLAYLNYSLDRYIIPELYCVYKVLRPACPLQIEIVWQRPPKKEKCSERSDFLILNGNLPLRSFLNHAVILKESSRPPSAGNQIAFSDCSSSLSCAAPLSSSCSLRI